MRDSRSGLHPNPASLGWLFYRFIKGTHFHPQHLHLHCAHVLKDTYLQDEVLFLNAKAIVSSHGLLRNLILSRVTLKYSTDVFITDEMHFSTDVCLRITWRTSKGKHGQVLHCNSRALWRLKHPATQYTKTRPHRRSSHRV